jgi:hypothetical protein
MPALSHIDSSHTCVTGCIRLCRHNRRRSPNQLFRDFRFLTIYTDHPVRPGACTNMHPNVLRPRDTREEVVIGCRIFTDEKRVAIDVKGSYAVAIPF